MITSLVFLMLGLPGFVLPQDGAGQQALQQLQQVRQELGGLRNSFDQLKGQVQNELRPICSAQVSWQPATGLKALNAETPVTVGLISMVSAPADSCIEAEVKITANYYDVDGMFVCSGSTSLGQKELVQNHYFEFRPLVLEYFAKWRDRATWAQSNFHAILCYDYEGVEVREPASQSTLLRLFATVLPKRGGVATAELQIGLPRQLQPRR